MKIQNEWKINKDRKEKKEIKTDHNKKTKSLRNRIIKFFCCCVTGTDEKPYTEGDVSAINGQTNYRTMTKSVERGVTSAQYQSNSPQLLLVDSKEACTNSSCCWESTV